LSTACIDLGCLGDFFVDLGFLVFGAAGIVWPDELLNLF